MLAVVHIEESEFTLSAWEGSELRLFLRQPSRSSEALARALRLLPGKPEKLLWVGKPLRDTLARLALFSWPGRWPEFKRFIVDNPLTLQSRTAPLFGGETFFYPREWLPADAGPESHAEMVAKVFGIRVTAPGAESAYYPFPSDAELRSWMEQLELKSGVPGSAKASGRALYWQRSERYWLEDGMRVDLSREENSALWEPRDLWALFQSGKISRAVVGERQILSPVAVKP